MGEYLAAIDQGTTSSRCMLFDKQGRPAACAQREHRQIYPQSGWVEHDPIEIRDRVFEVIRESIASSSIDESHLAGIGVTNQRETLVIWNRQTGVPYLPAIVWQDTRSRVICDQLERSVGSPWFREKTGLPIATYFTGPKLQWALEEVHRLRAEAERGDAVFGTIDSWLIYWLTGGPDGGRHLTDITNASRTMLMDLRALTWDDEVFEMMRIPRSMAPEIVASIHRSAWGVTRADGPFGREIPIGGVIGDQHAALLGQGGFGKGAIKNTYGTGCFMLINTGPEPVRSSAGLVTTPAYQIEGSPAVYALEGSIAIAGALVHWLRDNLGLIQQSDEIESLAAAVEDNGGVYFVPAFSGLFAPYWRSDARGVIAGLTRYATREHLARAALEATAFQTLDVYHAMVNDAGVTPENLRVDGGMVRNDLLMQTQADLLDIPVVRPSVTETTALGAAFAAGLGTGMYASSDEIERLWVADHEWRPQMSPERRTGMIANWKRAVDRSFDWDP